MSDVTWLRKLLGPRLFVNGTQVTPEAGAWNLLASPGSIAAAFNANTRRIDITITTEPEPVVFTPGFVLSGTQNNWTTPGLAGADIVRVQSDAPINVTGITAVSTHLRKLLVNIGAFDITLKQENIGSLAANRFTLADFGDVVVAANHCVQLWYDVASLRWRNVD